MGRNKFWITIAGVIGIIFIGFTVFPEMNGDQTAGMAVSYESLQEISENSSLIVQAVIPDRHMEREVRLPEIIHKETIHTLDIQEVFKDETGKEITDESRIQLNRLIGMTQNRESGFASTHLPEHLNAGIYLLFLNEVTHPVDGESYFVSNSPHHLYKWAGNGTFRNISSDSLKKITAEELKAQTS